MNLKKTTIISALFALTLLTACASDSARVVDGFENLEKFQNINLDVVSASENMKEFSISTAALKARNVPIFSTKSGLLKPNSWYTVRLKYKIVPANFSETVNMTLRALASTGAPLNQYHMGASKPTSFVKMAFKTPENDANATVAIFADGNFTGNIRDFSISEGDGETYIPVVADSKPYEGDLGKLPTGSENFDIDLPRPAKELVLNAADFGLDEKIENAATVMNRAIAKCRELGASKLIVPKGRYKVFENQRILVEGFTDFTLDAQGSTFVARKTASENLAVVGCVRTKICNLNMDYDWATEPLGAIVKILDVKRDTVANKTDIDICFVDYDKYPLFGQKVRIANMENYDPVAKAVGQEGGKSFGFGFGPNSKSPDVEWLSQNTLRIKCNWLHATAEKDKYYRLQHYYYGMGGMALINNKHLTLENTEIFSCKGHGIFCAGEQAYVQFINVNIRPPKDEPKRVITCTADHLHFARSRGHFKMTGCEFCLGSDDCINIHDLSAFGVKIDDYTIQLKAGAMPDVGNTVEFRQGDYSPAKYKSQVVSVNVSPDKKSRFVTFKDKIPNPKFDGFILFNREYDSSHVIIRDCYFHSNRARGLLILASNMTIENCRFKHNQMGALKFESGYTFNLWSEGFGVSNILVRGCSFDSVNPQGVRYQNKVRDVFMGVYMRHDPSLEQTKFPVITNILFENNKFKDSYGVIALISSSKNIIFKDNVFENVTPRIEEMPYRGSFYINHSSDTKIVNNTWVKSPLVKNAGVFVDKDTSKNILVEGNKVIEKSE